MKKVVKSALSLMLAAGMSVSSAMALDYSGCQNNPATFETLQETRISSPLAVQNLETNTGRTFVSHPVLDAYTEGTTFVYRSANLFGGRAAARLNTNLLVFSDKHFEDKDSALAYLKELGVIDIIDEAVGSVVLVTPANPDAGFGAVDQKNYYALQTAMVAQKQYARTADGKVVRYSDAEYFGGYGYIYAIGIDGGATFLNEYVASAFDYCSRLAGMLLINGSMEDYRDVSTFVPVYMVNAKDKVLSKYMKANQVDASDEDDETLTLFNQAQPLQKVIVAKQDKSVAEHIKDAYYNMFIKAMRVPVIKAGLYSAGTPYSGYGFDQAPYSLCDRNAVINGVTEDGIYLTRHDGDNFIEYQNAEGEYLQTWFEYLPAEVQNHTAPAGSVPLILANHGGSDDPRVFVDEIGLLDLIGKERIAVVAPEHQYISGEYQEVEIEALPAIVKYMLDTYPELDPSRVYVTGYSMGGSASLKTVYAHPEMFAAVVSMSPVHGLGEFYVPDEEKLMKAYEGVELPIMFTTSSCDLGFTVDAKTHNIGNFFQQIVNRFLRANHMAEIENFDFDTYPVVGFKADRWTSKTLNNEYRNQTWYLNNAKGIPTVAVSYTDSLVHALYPEYSKVAWNFMKHYTRNLETGEVEYNPYVD